MSVQGARGWSSTEETEALCADKCACASALTFFRWSYLCARATRARCEVVPKQMRLQEARRLPRAAEHRVDAAGRVASDVPRRNPGGALADAVHPQQRGVR